ncbi:Rieske (2Fe-2S) protein [Myxococcus sp. CA051A]|uniref:Rieske (2Fe-2S) protein n=1 Tax=unclassified Myxococcus TaxID=2648731 RepID=UPI00157B1905|nr:MULTISPECIES: Rieske (2Fe-2S) protein [unclassified Myxococcus]NTX32852.1 Rieske (2Fe-2S) protein [Myxococcus sp. CA033]NTX60083.1 Rieske (2Fe-2S) protein [Myxococcus sp. CA051A]
MTALMRPATEPAVRDSRPILEGPGIGYHQNWYAVCLSRELKPGKIVGRGFLDGKVIAFRGKNGKAQVMSAYCSHIGADLSIGDVIGDEVRCPFHHWQYNQEGVCTHIPVGCKIPDRARIQTFPTAEKWGMVWAFNGEKPLFDVPGVRGYEEGDLLYGVKVHEAGFPVPPWVMVCNSHDYQHLHTLHELGIIEGPINMNSSDYVLEHDVHYTTRDGLKVENWNRVTGTNTFSAISRTPSGPIFGMFTGTRIPGGGTRAYLLAGVPRKEGKNKGRPPTRTEQFALVSGTMMSFLKDAPRLLRAAKFMQAFLDDDEGVLQTIQFRQGVMVEADKTLLGFLKYVREYPKADLLSAA